MFSCVSAVIGLHSLQMGLGTFNVARGSRRLLPVAVAATHGPVANPNHFAVQHCMANHGSLLISERESVSLCVPYACTEFFECKLVARLH